MYSTGFLDATTHLYRRSCSSVRPSVGSIIFSNNEKRHSLCSDDDEIRHGPRDSQGQFQNDIKMLFRRSVCPSDLILRGESKKKRTINDDEVSAFYEPRGSY